MNDARILCWVLAEPARAAQLSLQQWTSLLTVAHAERLLASLAYRLTGFDSPPGAARVLDRARRSAEVERTQALWEAEMARRALAGIDAPVILLKGTAYVAAGLTAGQGRLIGDLDILVPRDRLDAVEAALLAAGWEWVKADAYDDAYYRQHMHELPPLIHRERDRMIDVHHTILPPTARHGRVDAATLIAAARPLTTRHPSESWDPQESRAPDSQGGPNLRWGDGALKTLAPEDMIIHAVAHLFADGDLSGGLRNLWDIDRLLREFQTQPDFWQRLLDRARHHSLTPQVSRALRLAHHLYETPVDKYLAYEGRKGDIFHTARLLARNGWGQDTRKALRFAFYLRSHWIRMPPLMLARHLWVKWRKGHDA